MVINASELVMAQELAVLVRAVIRTLVKCLHRRDPTAPGGRPNCRAFGSNSICLRGILRTGPQYSAPRAGQTVVCDRPLQLLPPRRVTPS